MLCRWAVVVLWLLLAVETQVTAQTSSTVSDGRAPTTIRVTGDHNFPPYEFLEHGVPSGFNIDLIREIARVIDLHIVIDLRPWSQARNSLEDGSADIVSGMFYSPERERTLAFSVPHGIVHYDIFVRKGSPIRSFEGMRGKVVLVQNGDIMHEYLSTSHIAASLRPVDDVPVLLEMLARGSADCAVVPSVTGRYYIKRQSLKNLVAVSQDIMPQQYCFAVRYEDRELLARLNQGLSILHENGTYRKLTERWFGVYEEASVWRWLRYPLILLGILIILLVVVVIWNRTLAGEIRKRTKELADSEVTFRTVFMSSPSIIGITTMSEGRFIDANETFLTALGYTRDELIGRTSVELHLWEDPRERAYVIGLVTSRGVLINHEGRFRTKTGDILDGLISIAQIPVRGEECLITVVNDITLQKKAESDLVEQLYFLQQLIDSIPNPVFYRDLSGGRTGYNRVFKQTIDPTDSGFWELAARPPRMNIEDNTEQESGERGSDSMETVMRFADGVLHDVMLVRAAYYTTERHLAGIVGVVIDITDRKRIEQELRIREEQYRHLVEGVDDIFYEVDVQGIITYVSPVVQRKIGVSPDRIIGHPFSEFVDPDYWQSVADSLNDRLSGLESKPLEFRARVADGTGFWVRSMSRPIVRDGAVVGVRGVMTNITERKMVEEALEASHRRLVDVIDFLPDAMFAIDNDGTVIIWNKAVEEMTGWSKERVLGKNGYIHGQAFYGAPRPILIDMVLNYNSMTEELYDQFERQGEILFAEAVIPGLYQGRGATLWGKASLLRDSSGREVGAIETVRDITERREAEDALRESEQKFRGIIEQSVNGIVVLDEEDRIIEWNHAEEILTGYRRDEVIGSSFTEMYRLLIVGGEEFSDPEEFTVLFNRFRQTGQAPWGDHLAEQTLVHKDGTTRTVQIVLFAIASAKGFMACLMSHDITELREAERRAEAQREQLFQAAKMSSLGMLVSGVAHEINNPNQFILSNTTILRTIWEGLIPLVDATIETRGDIPIMNMTYSDLREHMPLLFKGILDGSDRIRYIVQELRDFSRQETGALDDAVDLNKVVHSAVLLVSAMLKKATDNVSLTLADTIPMIRGNHRRLEQVVINLLQNACQALTTKDQGVFVTTGFDKTLNAVVLEIQDEGRGIAKDDLPRVTDPFFTTRRETGGSGLGLSISLSIIHDHGGRLTFSSKEGAGTIARVELPLRKPKSMRKGDSDG